MLLILAKITHITTVIIFMGCVFFRTFTVPKIRKHVDADFYAAVDRHLTKASRDFGKYNALVLMLSGLYLAYIYYSPTNVLLNIKITLGLSVVVIFLLAPFFVHKINDKYPSFKIAFHWTVLGLMFALVVLSQTMFFL